MRSIWRSTNRFVELALVLACLSIPRVSLGQEHDEHDHEAEHDPARRHLAHADAHGGFPAFVDIFFTHHAYLERKLHPRFEATLAEELDEYAGSGELVWQFGGWLGAEVEAALVGTSSDIGDGATGISDIEVAPMIAFVQDPSRLLVVALRSAFVLPTGDEDEGLGIDGWGWEPGLLVWDGFGPEKRAAIQAELRYDRVFADEGPDEEALVYNLGFSYWLPSNWIPILELNGVTPIGRNQEEADDHEHAESGRALVPAHGELASEETLIAATAGFRYAFANGQQWGAGIQVPVHDTAVFDVRLVIGGIVHVD